MRRKRGSFSFRQWIKHIAIACLATLSAILLPNQTLLAQPCVIWVHRTDVARPCFSGLVNGFLPRNQLLLTSDGG
jgi:hypothetical protein